MQKDRAARNVEQSRQVDYIKDEVAKRLCERLLVRLPPPFLELTSQCDANFLLDRILKGLSRILLTSAQIVATSPEL